MPVIDRKKIITAIVVLILLVPIFIYITNPLVVTVEGVGQVEAKPDSATVAFVVYSQKASAKEANDEVVAKSKVFDGILSTYGAASQDIVKSQPTVVPSGLSDPSKAFTASVSMGAKIKNVEQASGLVSVLYANGAYYVSQPILAVDDATKLEDQAYAKALSDAGKQVNRLALRNLKLFRKKIAITQYSTGGSSTVTSKNQVADVKNETDPTEALNDTFKTTKVVSVTYKMW